MEAWRPSPDDESAARSGFAGDARERLVAWVRYLGWGRLLGALASTIVLVALGWLLLRQPAAPVEGDLVYATTSAPASVTTQPTTVTVHVAGRVRRPGVYDLPATSRVIDALNMAEVRCSVPTPTPSIWPPP